MLVKGNYILCILFVLLLTIVLYGIGQVVIKMAYGKLSEEKAKLVLENKQKITALMYIPQAIMLIIVLSVSSP